MKFPISPVAVEFPNDLLLTSEVRIELSNGGSGSAPYILISDGFDESRSWPISSYEEVTYGEWDAVMWLDPPLPPELGGNLPVLRIRAARPRDAEGAATFARFIRVPMPVEVIRFLTSAPEGSYQMPQLYALTDDDGFVVTMLFSAPTGLYVRYASVWRTLPSDDVIDGLNVYEVAPEALTQYDEADRMGQMVNVTSMTSASEELSDADVEMLSGGPSDEVSKPSVTASAAPKKLDIPVLRNADDAAAAIAAAAADPEIQWWVERRLASLGIDAALPWQQ